VAAHDSNDAFLERGKTIDLNDAANYHRRRSKHYVRGDLTMPHFENFPFPCRYNTLRLLGYDYNSVDRLCAVTLVTDSRRPVFADTQLAKAILTCLLNDETLAHLHLHAFTLMPNHLHVLAGVRRPELNLPRLIGNFKSYTTQQYWKRSREILALQQVSLPSTCVTKSDVKESRALIAALIDGRATLRPEVVELKNWPTVKPQHFLRKSLWQQRFFDHVIRNDTDLRENLNYIAMNPVREGYVTQPHFYPYTALL
jgi:REP element-mobilizing transposase RayT